MVRNIQGGSKTKSQARKSSTSVINKTSIRLSKNVLEIYACVTKMLGHGQCYVRTVDDKELHCIIRKKFKGRSKRHNIISAGTILLVGLREWESSDNYKNCDVIEIYDNEDYIQLKNIASTKVNQLDKYITSLQGDREINDNLVFTDEVDDEYAVKKQHIPLEPLNEIDNENDEINVDDI